MIIYVDADACPVKDIIKKIAKKYKIPVTMVMDTSHILSDDYCSVVTVSKANDSADYYIISKIQKNDVLVTQDYGLASIVLSKKAKVINQNGLVYTDENIDRLLLERHINREIRTFVKRRKHNKKRVNKDNYNFSEEFEKLIINLLNAV